MAFFKEFKEFALKGNVMDMAVGVIIGGAFGKIVSSLVNDILMPPIGALLGAVMIYWVLGMDSIGRELMTGRKKPLLHGFAFLAKYVYIFLAGAVVVCSFAIKGGIG